MNANPQYQLNAADLETLLALVRAGTLADAGARLGVDGSTVFRTLQRIEKGLGQRLFDRSRAGYRPTELALQIGRHAERVEAELEAARAAAQSEPGQVSGTVRLTTTDTLLHGLVLPALPALARRHPLLQFELTATNELASLTKRDADLALRATRRPPEHLVGKRLGPLHFAVYCHAGSHWQDFEQALAEGAGWIAPDDAMPEHPSVRWRRQHLPKVVPRYRVNSVLSVLEAVAANLGLGVLPQFLARHRPELRALTDPLPACASDLWLLTHPESRHLRRIGVVYSHLADTLAVD